VAESFEDRSELNDWMEETTRYTAPRQGAMAGRLVFVGGLSQVALRSSPELGEDLLRATFEGPAPRVDADSGDVWIRYRFFFLESLRRALTLDHDPAAGITLSAAVPWQILVRGGASELCADLRGVELSALELRGGAIGIQLDLPRPKGVVPIHITGGAADISIRRPAGVAARVGVRGGASRLAVDRQYLGAVGGGCELKSGDPEGGSGYEIRVSGGACDLTVDTYL
jgi:hypothetical protein